MRFEDKKLGAGDGGSQAQTGCAEAARGNRSALPHEPRRADRERGRGRPAALAENFARAETNTSANIDAQGRAVAEVSTRLLVFQGEASAQFVSINRAIVGNGEALVQAQTLLQAQIGQVSASVTREEQARVTADAAQASRTEGLLARVGVVESGLVNERAARSAYDEAASSELSKLYAITGGQSASITTLNTSFTNYQGSVSTAFQNVNARFDAVEGRTAKSEADVTTLTKSQADDRSANASTFQYINARFGDVSGYLQSLTKAYSDADTAIGQRIDTVNARVGGVEAGLVTEQKARADAVSAEAARTTQLIAQTDSDRGYLQGLGRQTDSDRAYFLASEQARIGAEGALTTRLETLVAQTNSDRTYFLNEQTARISNDNAFASQIQDVYARTDAGTAAGRIKFEAVSAPSGVTARFGIQLSTDRNGAFANAGFFMDILPNGRRRTVFDADDLALSSDGGVTYPFAVQDGIVTIRDLRVTQTAILPGSVTGPYSLPVSDFDPGGSSDQWREIPGTALALAADTGVWSIMFSGTADVSITVVGTAATTFSATLEVAIGVDGAVYAVGAFASSSRAAGGGLPTSVTERTGLRYSAASLEFVTAGQPRRFSLLYRFRADPGSSGRINYAQFKALVTKR